MTVICNATPLINFAAINRLDILQATFGQIIIPQAVFHETTGTDFPSSHFVQQAIAASWLEVRTIFPAGANIAPELDAGEREAIPLLWKRAFSAFSWMSVKRVRSPSNSA
jgi:uncharacterized protein